MNDQPPANNSTSGKEHKAENLLVNLLFYITRCGADTPRIRAVVQGFGLDGALPPGWEEDWHSRRTLDGGTVRGLAEGLHREVDAIKELVEEIRASSSK